MRSARRAEKSRGFTVVEVAVGVAIGGSVLAVAVPAFVKELHASRFVEPMDGVTRLGAAAVAYAHAHAPARGSGTPEPFPPSVGWTPATPPRATRTVDPPGTWDAPTWRALDFRASPEGEPHAFSFGFDADDGPRRSVFAAHAHGDLDGDGVTSRFEVRGHADPGRPAEVDPGTIVASEVE